MNRAFPSILAVIVVIATSVAASAADWPTKSVRIVVPYPPGGGADTLARDVGEFLSKRWGQSVVIDNRAGAAGSIGASYAAKAAPDGYTLLVIQAGPVNAFLTRKVPPYDPVKDFTPIILTGRSPTVLSVPAKSPFKTLEDVIKAAKEKPGTVTYGSPGIATPGHIAAELFQAVTGTKLVHVPFPGSSPLMTNLLGGQINLSFDTVSSNAELIRSGQTRAFIVSSTARSQAIPDVPTGIEKGVKDWESYTWYAFSGPAGIPREIVDRINADTSEYIKSPAGTKRMDELGLLPERGGSPERLGDFIKSELDRLAPVVKSANIVTD